MESNLVFFIVLVNFFVNIFGCQEIPEVKREVISERPPRRFVNGIPYSYNNNEYDNNDYVEDYEDRNVQTEAPRVVYTTLYSTIICSNLTSLDQLFYPYAEKEFEQRLTIKDSNIPTLQPSDLLSFTTITQLRLSHLHTRTILPGAFNGLTRLKVLHLNHNELSELSKGVYNSLHRLEILNLANNRIHQIENMALVGVDNLLELHLQSNNLSRIEDGTFETLKHLTILDLSENPLEEFSLDGLTNLDTLNMTESALTRLDVDMSHLTMKCLNLSSSFLSSVDFSYFPRVDRVDLSKNRIVSVENCQNLDSIYVRLDNNRIKVLNGTFNGVSELYLSHNEMKVLERTVFENSKNILTIDVSFNAISTIEKGVFRGLISLTQLLLQNNEISEIDPSLFQDLTSLTFLNLSHNKISEFQFGTFDNLGMLEILDISHNNLNYLQVHAFNSLSNLAKLYFDNNQISSFNVQDLQGHLRSLRFISLNNNSWNCQDLVKIARYLTLFKSVAIAKGSSHDVDNYHGIACRNEQNSDFVANSSGFSVQNFSRNFQKAVDEGVRNSKMERFFNGDFKNSKFFQYFERDYGKSDFFKYLDNYKFATLKQQNFNESKMEKLTSLQVTPNDYNNKILVFSAVIQVLIVIVLVCGILFLFNFVRKVRYFDQKPTLSSQMELC